MRCNVTFCVFDVHVLSKLGELMQIVEVWPPFKLAVANEFIITKPFSTAE